MIWRTSLGLVVLVALLVNVGDGPVAISVTPRRAFVRGDARALVIVEPDAQNRRLSVIADNGESYYRRSDEQLDGADAPRSRDVWFKTLPDGQYIIAAVVTRADGSQRQARTTLCVLGPNQESCE